MLKEEELQLPGLVNPDDARVNKDIEIANQAKLRKYFESVAKQVTKAFKSVVDSVEAHHRETINGGNLNSQNAARKRVKQPEETQVEPVDDAIMKVFDEIKRKVDLALQSIKSCGKLTEYWRNRSTIVIRKIQEDVCENVPHKAWIWKTNNTMLKVWYDLEGILRDLITWLGELEKKPDIMTVTAIQNAIFTIEVRGELYQSFFMLEPRMINKVTRMQGAIEYTPFEVSYPRIQTQIKANLQETFPSLNPLQRTEYKIKKKIETIENRIPIYSNEEPDIFLKAIQSFNGYGKEQNFREAKELFEAAERKGIVEASNCLGKMYYEGKGVMRNYRLSHEHFARSAEKGNPEGLYWIGRLYEEGKAKDYENSLQTSNLALRYYEKAAKLEHSDAMTDLGFMYENGVGVPKNIELATQYYKKAILKHNPKAYNNLGCMYLKGEIKEKYVNDNEVEAFNNLTKSKELGYVEGIANLAICYYRGKGTEKSFTEAKKLFKEAASKDSITGKYHMAFFQLKEAQISSDERIYHDAANKLRLVIASDPMHDDANYYLGYLHENGLGVTKDLKSAYHHYEVAVEASAHQNTKAMYKLAGLCFTGAGDTFENKEKAFRLYNEAAALGDQDALNALGVLYQNGIVVEKNENKAIELFSQAINKNNPIAHRNLAFLVLEKQKRGESLGGVNARTGMNQSENISKQFNPQELLARASKLGDEASKDFLNTKMGRRVLNELGDKSKNDHNKFNSEFIPTQGEADQGGIAFNGGTTFGRTGMKAPNGPQTISQHVDLTKLYANEFQKGDLSGF